MKKRDLAEDLKTCNRASSGPWRATIRRETPDEIAAAVRENGRGGVSQCSMVVVNTPQAPTVSNVVVWMGPAAGGFTSPCKGGVDDNDDAQFVAEAREGWPEAIRRAIEAEAEIERLRAILIEAR